MLPKHNNERFEHPTYSVHEMYLNESTNPLNDDEMEKEEELIKDETTNHHKKALEHHLDHSRIHHYYLPIHSIEINTNDIASQQVSVFFLLFFCQLLKLPLLLYRFNIHFI